MKALLTMFNSLPVSAIWGKIKIGMLVGAVSFMVWQGWQMSTLQQDVTKLEALQSNLQQQVQQMSVDYSVLRSNYQNNAQTSEQYVQSLNQLNGKSTELEKSFSALDKKVAMASQKADTAPTPQRSTTPGVSNEKRSTQAPTSPVGDVSRRADGTDAEWRQLLDNTYCSIYPGDTRCNK